MISDIRSDMCSHALLLKQHTLCGIVTTCAAPMEEQRAEAAMATKAAAAAGGTAGVGGQVRSLSRYFM